MKSKQIGYDRRRPGKLSVIAAAVAMLGMSAWGTALAGPADVCIPAIGGLGGIPSIDGNLYGDGTTSNPPDVGWNRAARVILQGNEPPDPNSGQPPTSGAPPHVWMQLGRTASDVYLSLEVTVPLEGIGTTVVLAFSVDGDRKHDWRIHMHPLSTGGGDTPYNQPLQAVEAWRNSNTWNNPPSQANPANEPVAISPTWLQAAAGNVRWSRKGVHWYLEMKIPIKAAENDGINFPASGPFNFYANVLSQSTITNTVEEASWPNGVFIQPVPPATWTTLEVATPLIGAWGTYSLNDRPGVCDGVSIDWSDVGVAETDSGPISNRIRVPACNAADVTPSGPSNYYTAKPKNSMTSTIAHVSATFRHASWGLPGQQDFEPISGPSFSGTNTNPTAEVAIPPSSQGLVQANWKLTPAQACNWAGKHRCMQVDLDSQDPNTRFVTKSVQRNMDFGTASTFTADAVVSKNHGRLVSGPGPYKFLLLVETELKKPMTEDQTKAVETQVDKLKVFRARLSSSETHMLRAGSVDPLDPIGWVFSDSQGPGGGTPNGDTDFAYIPGRPWTPKPGTPEDPSKPKAFIPDALIPAGARFADVTLERFARSVLGRRASVEDNMASWVVRGYAYKGGELRIAGKPYSLVKSVGEFGYVASHRGTLAGWTYDFGGRAVRQLTSNAFEVTVGKDDPTQAVTTVINAVDKVPCTCFCFSRGTKVGSMTSMSGLLILGVRLRRRKQKDQPQSRGAHA